MTKASTKKPVGRTELEVEQMFFDWASEALVQLRTKVAATDLDAYEIKIGMHAFCAQLEDLGVDYLWECLES